jgi:triacylglycerol lipase
LYPQGSADNIPVSHPGEFDTTIGLQFKRMSTILNDIHFQAPRRLAARAWLAHSDSHANLYSYRFNTIPNGIADYFAVTHFQEVAFVFHNIEGQGFPDVSPPYFGANPFLGKPQSYFDLADDMSRRWAAFIHDGNPNYCSRKC